MTYLLPSFVLAVICSLNPNFRQLKEDVGKWFIGWLIRGVAIFLLSLLIFYLALPALVGPFWGVWGLALIFFALNCIITGLVADRFPAGSLLGILFLVVVMGRGCVGSGIFRASDYRDLLGHVEEHNFTEDTRPVDIKHIREVSKEQAIKFGGRVLGEAPGAIGSRYKPGNYSIQRVASELYWVAPLEFQGFTKWWSYEKTTGYIMVSAEDRTRKPELHMDYQGKDFEFRYMPSACFGDNLHRHIYENGYNRYNLTDFTLELDDEFRPWWVVTALHPTIQYWGKDVDGVIVVNPETGEMIFYKVDEVPDWIDRVYPEDLIESRITDWGQYIKGWWNSIWREEGVVKPAPYEYGPDVWLAWGDDDQPYWFTGLTSVKTSDQSMTGFMMVNSRIGKPKYFRESGASEDGSIESVTAHLGAEATRWRPTQPILHNVYGVATWIMPVISQEDLFQELAFVRVSNSQVVRGSSKRAVLQKYRMALVSTGREEVPGSQLGRLRLNGQIERIASDVQGGNTIYYFILKNTPGKIFTSTSQISHELPLASRDDPVSISFLQTDEGVIQLEKFDLIKIEVSTSPVQAEFETVRKGTEKRVKKDEAVRDIREQMKEMTPEELLKLKKQLKKTKE